MKKAIRLIGAILVLMACSSMVFAGFESGASLSNKWKEYKKRETGVANFNSTDAAFFVGYVEGIADSNGGVLFTIPESATAQQIMGVVGKWLDDHPSDLKKPADFLVMQALRAAYPLSDEK